MVAGPDSLPIPSSCSASWRRCGARCRTTEVEVDAGRRQFGQLRRVLGQTPRVATEKLDRHRRPRGGTATSREFRTNAAEGSRRQQVARHADELAHRQIVGADTRQHVTQDVVDETFHWRQQQFSHAPPDLCQCGVTRLDRASGGRWFAGTFFGTRGRLSSRAAACPFRFPSHVLLQRSTAADHQTAGCADKFPHATTSPR